MLLPEPPVGLTHLVYFELPYHNDRSQSLQNTETVSTFTAKNQLPPTLTDLGPLTKSLCTCALVHLSFNTVAFGGRSEVCMGSQS